VGGRIGSRAIESSSEAYSSIGGRTTGGRSLESSSESYSSRIGGSSARSIEMSSEQSGRERLALTSSSAEASGKPVFSKTIEGCTHERKFGFEMKSREKLAD